MDERQAAGRPKKNHYRNPDLTDKEGWRAFLVCKTRVTESGCMEWTGVKSRRGYVTTSVNDKVMLVHRIIFQVFNGDIPPGRRNFVCHRCDNPLCINPEHLFLGTALDNNRDALAKGRTSRGEKHSDAIKAKIPKGSGMHNAKLTESDVIRIRTELSGMRGIDIAAMYSVDPTLVSAIRKRKCWKHVA